MNWTKERPKQSGYYWFKDLNPIGDFAPAIVRVDDDLRAFFFTGNEVDCGFGEYPEAEWIGPLTSDVVSRQSVAERENAMAKLPDKIYIIDPYDEDGELVPNTEDVCWCADPVGDENIAYIAEQTVTDALAALREKLQPGLFWTEGTHRTAMIELDATIAALGLAPRVSAAPTPAARMLPIGEM